MRGPTALGPREETDGRRRPARRGTTVPRARDERGIAAPMAVTLAATLVAVAGLAATLGGLLVAQRRMASAADLSALAAATAVQNGADACAAAVEAARRNGAALAGCEARGQRVRVVTETPVSLVLGRTVPVRATAVAGPAE